MDARCADAVFYNGKVLTFSTEKKTARAIAVADGEIITIGTDAEVRRSAPRGCDKVDLGGKLVVPGFIDCHTHFLQMGVDSLSVDLSETGSLGQAMGLMKAAALKTRKGEWIVAANWSESRWSGGRFVSRADLDKCCPDHPAVAHRVCGHLSTVNSNAIKRIGVDRATPGAETGSSGSPTGIMKEAGVSVVRAATAPTPGRKMKGFQLAIRKAHSLGVTSIQDNGEVGDFQVLRRAEKDGKLGVRVWFNTPSSELQSLLSLGVSTGFGSERLKLGGVKMFCDGAIGARSAALSEPFADDPGNSGMFVHPVEELDETAAKADEAGIQLAIHAIGDEGIDVAISSIERALDVSGRKDHRHRIEHLELPRPDHIKRMRRRKMIASMQPNFVGEWSGIDGMYAERLGPERASMNNPFKEILMAKVRLVFGSDCMPFSPIYGIRSAVNASYPSQRLTMEEAFMSYTRNGAYASFEEDCKGTISTGKVADFIVLSGDPFHDPDALVSLSVLKTVVGGEVVFDRSTRSRR
ncbi:MAG: amidohydrolase [Candidatus Thermoplasmatota archaeon]|nr:amidohydrolase [Candidatus Thermoplasmatota archaeon]